MNLLLTGASGFVGRALLQNLVEIGLRVKACFRAQPHLQINNCECLVIPDFTIHEEMAWKSALSGIHTVVHAAARVHIMNDKALNPLDEFRRVNTTGTLNLARWAAEMGVKRFVFISSVKAMGEGTDIGSPFKADSPCQPVDPYGISKREAEIGLLEIAARTGLEVVIIRPPLVYGPKVKANFAALMGWLVKGMPLPFAAVRDNRRSFVSLRNLVDLIAVCISHPDAANQVFLASDAEDLSTADLLIRMGHALARPAKLFNCPVMCLRWGARVLGKEQVFDRLCGSLQLDVEKNRQILGWVPLQTVDEGLATVAAEYRK